MSATLGNALDRMARGERAVLAGVEVERVSPLEWKAFGVVLGRAELEKGLSALEERTEERLLFGAPGTEERIAELRRDHGRALRVRGQSKAKRARWTGQEAWLVASYPRKDV